MGYFLSILLVAASFIFSSCAKLSLPENLADSVATIDAAFVEYKAVITKVENRMLITQNSDGGWDWIDTPENLASSTNQPTAFANMFGVNAMGVLDSYTVNKDPAALAAAKKTADTLMAKPLSRTQRLFANDCELLIRIGDVVGDSSYRQKGEQGQIFEKEYLAAVVIFATTSPTNEQVASLTQEEISAVTDSELVNANRSRFIAAGRNASIRAYDWSARMRVALLRGDSSYHRAMADALVSDYSEIAAGQSSDLLGIAATINSLTPLKAEAAYADVISQAHTLLIAKQQSDGTFLGSDGAANLQDHAFIADALFKTGEGVALSKLLSALKVTLNEGGFIIDQSGNENPEAESELLSALTHIVTN